MLEQLTGYCHDTVTLRKWVTAAFPDKPLLHQHEPGSGKPIYQYPLVQYKIIERVPIIFGIGDGSEQVCEICSHIQNKITRLGPIIVRDVTLRVGLAQLLESEPKRYRFISPWLAFNKKNYRIYRAAEGWAERKRLINSVLIGNVLSMAKALSIIVDFTIRTKTKVDMMTLQISRHGLVGHGFLGVFETNLDLPPLLGLGRHVSLGYGTVIEEGKNNWIS